MCGLRRSLKKRRNPRPATSPAACQQSESPISGRNHVGATHSTGIVFERHKLRLHLLGQREAGVSALTIVDRTATDTCLYSRMHVRTCTTTRKRYPRTTKPHPRVLDVYMPAPHPLPHLPSPAHVHGLPTARPPPHPSTPSIRPTHPRGRVAPTNRRTCAHASTQMLTHTHALTNTHACALAWCRSRRSRPQVQ